MNTDKIKKIKGQRTAATALIIVPLILVMRYLIKNDFKIEGQNNYIIGASLIVLMFCGIMAFTRSSRKLKELNN